MKVWTFTDMDVNVVHSKLNLLVILTPGVPL